MIFGENLLALLVLAIGAALAVGNAMALLRPRSVDEIADDEVERPPLARSLGMIVLGLVAATWALASLVTSDSADETPAAAVVVSSAAANPL